VVPNIYNTVHNYNIKKLGTITGKAAIFEPQIQTNIWVASVDTTQKHLKHQDATAIFVVFELLFFIIFFKYNSLNDSPGNVEYSWYGQ